MGRVPLQKNTILDGWDIFERWARNFKKSCLQRQSTPALWTRFEMQAEISDPNDELGWGHISLSQDEKNNRIQSTVGFFRGYLVDISFDQGDFAARVKRLLKNHNNRDWKRGYAFYLETYDLVNAPAGGSWHFKGYDTNIFCDEINDVDFASAMGILPFDRLVIRNMNRRDWSASETSRVIEQIERDLEFDGMAVGLAEDHSDDDWLFLYAANPWPWAGRKKKRVGRTRKKNTLKLK